MVTLSGLNVRAATVEDVSAMNALDVSYETDYVWQIDLRGDETGAIQVGLRTARLPRLMKVNYPRHSGQLQAALRWDTDFGLLLSAELLGDVCGYALMRFDMGRSAAWIIELAVGRAWRRRGIGSVLLHSAYAHAQERGVRALSVETQTKNYPAISFCQKNGLVFCGYNDLYYANGDIALFFGQNVRS